MSLGRKDRFGGLCEQPRWRTTKRGRRCGQVCTDENGRRRYRFVPGSACAKASGQSEEGSAEGSGTNPEVMEFPGQGPMVGLEPVKLEPMPLLPLFGTSAGSSKRRGRK
jgi:hypothetical protein